MTLRVAALTGGLEVPSARFRVRQYISQLRSRGVLISEFPSKSTAYPPSIRSERPAWLLRNLWDGLRRSRATRFFDLTLLQKPMCSGFLTFERWTTRPRVLDIDDAIWLTNANMAESLAKKSSLCICGNSYLADKFSKWNPNTLILPTGIDTDRYSPRETITNRPTIGWIGSSSNLPELYAFEEALAEVLRRRPDACLRVVCDRPPAFTKIERERLEFAKWTEDRELEEIRNFSVGIMPLRDTPWNRGKCSFKLIQYMACGIPFVGSPVGANIDLMHDKQPGFLPSSLQDWTEALVSLIDERPIAESMGREGRRVALEKFSISVLAPRLAKALQEASDLHLD